MIAVLVAAVLFGTTGTAQALGPESTTPFGVGAARLVIGGAALAAVGLSIGSRRRRRALTRGDSAPQGGARAFALMALTGLCLALYQPLFFLGTARNGVAVGTVIALGSAPVLAGLLEWALTRRRPTPSWMTATALATIGVALLAVTGGGSAGADGLGVLGSLGAGASFAVIANAQRRLISGGWDAFTVSGAMGAGAAVCGLAMIPVTDMTWLADPRGWPMALWLGIATVALAYALFTWGLSGLTAATAATLTLAEPLTASLLGVLLLGEHLAPLALVGLAVLAAGLVLLALTSRSRRNPAPTPLEA
ncbi:DMT family transporter [Microbacterium sp. cf332]|uniref:DMT family transporter n=1 Tax=Microbacterium sp. cf332 TaxID=1761804 RepID=UPI00087E4BCF|nr:DMT family transporter [Microbacterium sp. cf332]SDQ87181.1 drug/metabolite transporter, DME family [Microbacterium sp. cf332]